jgi:hypothetical protein
MQSAMALRGIEPDRALVRIPLARNSIQQILQLLHGLFAAAHGSALNFLDIRRVDFYDVWGMVMDVP